MFFCIKKLAESRAHEHCHITSLLTCAAVWFSSAKLPVSFYFTTTESALAVFLRHWQYLSFLFSLSLLLTIAVFSALTLLVACQEEHPACKKFEWCSAGIVICLEWGADDLHVVQLMSLLPPHLSLPLVAEWAKPPTAVHAGQGSLPVRVEA